MKNKNANFQAKYTGKILLENWQMVVVSANEKP